MAEATTHGWWRRNRWWLAGAVVLGALALAMPYRAAQEEYGRRGYWHPVDAGNADWATYRGARWRVVEVLRDDTVGNLAGGYPHTDASMLMVVYEVIPGAGVDAALLDHCRGRLSDGKGRHWGGPAWGESAALDRDGGGSGNHLYRIERALGLESGCGSRTGAAVAEQAVQGRAFRFVHLFLVPRGLASAGLHAEIVVDPFETDPPGQFVRFNLGEARPWSAGATPHN